MGVLAFAAAAAPREVIYEGSCAPLEPDGAYESALTVSFDGGGWAAMWTAGHVVGAGLRVAVFSC